jgi:autotransporter-associated beta strand protein
MFRTPEETMTDKTDTQQDALTLAELEDANGGLTKTGAGTLTLAAANTYTGTTSVAGGTLTVNG